MALVSIIISKSHITITEKNSLMLELLQGQPDLAA